MENINLNRFLDKFGGVIAGRSLAKLVVSNPRDRSSDLRSITYSLAEIRGGDQGQMRLPVCDEGHHEALPAG